MSKVKSFEMVELARKENLANLSTNMKWWHCAIIYIVSNIISFIPAGYNGDEAFYNSFSQPAAAPPDWLFAPMWLFLNITSLIGLYTISNLPKGTKNRKAIIALEYSAWILFAIFSFLYFYLKSPILAALNTFFGFLIVVIVVVMSYGISKKSFFCFLPRLLWLALATYVSAWIALKNKDIFFDIGPFIN